MRRSRTAAWEEGGGAPSATIQEEETMPLSVRTESDIPTTQELLRRNEGLLNAAAAHSAPQVMERGDAAAAAAIDNADDTAEYILVDGDLIAVPPPPPNQAEQEFLEDRVRDQLHANQDVLSRNCQPKGVRRGVRKFTRLFKRNRNKGKPQPEDTHISGKASKPVSASLPPSDNPPSFGPVSLREQEFHSAPNLAIDTAAATTNNVNLSSRSLSPLPTRPADGSSNLLQSPPVAGLPATTGLSPPATAAAKDDRKQPPASSAAASQQHSNKSPTRKLKHSKKKWGVRGRRKAPPPSLEEEPEEMGVETQLLRAGLSPPSHTNGYNNAAADQQYYAAAAAAASFAPASAESANARSPTQQPQQ